MWQALQFDWLSAAWLLLLLFPIVWMMFILNDYRKKRLQAFALQPVLDVVVEKREPFIFWIKAFFFCLALVSVIFVLMQPKGNERYISTSPDGQITVKKSASEKTVLRKKAHEVIFLIDASASMKISETSGKTRLETAKEIADDVIRHLKGENVSLFAFTSSTIQIVPSTLDYLFTRLMLQQIQINEGETEGTDIKQALAYLQNHYLATPKTKTVIVLSDGGDTRLAGLKGDKRTEAVMGIVSPIAAADDRKIRIFTVGIGSSQGKEVPGVVFQGHPVISVLEEPLLRKLSAIGKGEFYGVGEMTSFQISQLLSQSIARDEEFVDTSADAPPDLGEKTHIFDDYFRQPLAVAILALMGYLLIPDTRKKVPGRRIQ